jgi:hypothetical protein
MLDTIETLAGRLKDLAGSWASYSAFGSFALYVVGYLALRFHLTALGVGTDLAVLDERYLFTGAKFLIYLCSTIPILVLIMLAVGLPALLLIYLPYRLLRRGTRKDDGKSTGGFWQSTFGWRLNPSLLALTGVVISVLLIQFVMRQCFNFNNLLLAARLPQPSWLQQLLLAEDDGARSIYFTSLVAGVIITTTLLVIARIRAGQSMRSRFLTALLAALVVIQFLLLPVNYGVLIVDKAIPRVADLGGTEQLQAGQEAWLVWEGKDGVTYLVRGTGQNGSDSTNSIDRRLVTLPQKEVKKTQIIQYDAILPCIFAERCGE